MSLAENRDANKRGAEYRAPSKLKSRLMQFATGEKWNFEIMLFLATRESGTKMLEGQAGRRAHYLDRGLIITVITISVV